MDEITWFPFGVRCPYVRKIILQEPEKLVFNGYFYLEDQTMPVQRIMHQNNKLILVEITSKKTMEDTSVYGIYDEDMGGSCCFFPTNIIEIQYTIIKVIDDLKEFDKLQKDIEALDVEVTERNETHRRAREEEEFKRRAEEWRNMDYKKFFESMREDIPDDL